MLGLHFDNKYMERKKTKEQHQYTIEVKRKGG